MRPAPLMIATAASLALCAGVALASPSSHSASPPPPASTGTGADTSATTGAFTVGMPVKDSTGAVIGSIASLDTDASGKQNAVIKMGADQFAVPTDKLGQGSGAATINLSQSQIQGMLHKDTATGGAAPGAAAGAPPSAAGKPD